MIFNYIAIILVIFHNANGIPLEPKSANLSSFFQSSRIVGGEDAPESYLFHQAALVYGEDYRFFMCGASIISTQHILTAAHCIDPFVSWWTGELMPSAKAIVGTIYWGSGGTEVGFKSYYNHPHWDPYTIKNDIGILTLTQDLILSKNVGLVTLGYERVTGGERGCVTGWGLTSAWGELPRVLQLLYVRIISPEECEKGIRAAAEELGHAPPMDPELEICTFHSPGHGMCNGDSGSALMTVKDQKQVGIVSWGFPCARGAPDMFTRISAHEKFLEKGLSLK